MRKIGESCSTENDKGVCGAINSECADGTCKCKGGYVSMWGGEACFQYPLTTFGETCSSSLGMCATQNQCKKGASFSPNSVLDHTAPLCGCSENQQLQLPNSLSASWYTGRKVPLCVDGKKSTTSNTKLQKII